MTYGNCRVTVLDTMGRPYVADVKEGDLWYFPAGYPHSLQGLGPDGCEFVICFDNGDASEFNTLLVTDWFTHTPPAVLAKNFGVPAETFANIPLHDLWIFQGKMPGDLAADRAAVTGAAGAPPHPFTFSSRVLDADERDQRRRSTDRRQQQFQRFHDSRRGAGDACGPAGCARCIGIRMPTNGNITSRAKPAWGSSIPAPMR